jgi:hypothetical protein
MGGAVRAVDRAAAWLRVTWVDAMIETPHIADGRLRVPCL